MFWFASFGLKFVSIAGQSKTSDIEVSDDDDDDASSVSADSATSLLRGEI